MKFHEYLIDEHDDEGGWVDTHYFNDSKEGDVEVTLGEEATETTTTALPETSDQVHDESDDSEAEDIESYMKDEKLDDEDDPVSLWSFFSEHLHQINFLTSQRVLSISRRFPRMWAI